jgi:hypothetical protein
MASLILGKYYVYPHLKPLGDGMKSLPEMLIERRELCHGLMETA